LLESKYLDMLVARRRRWAAVRSRASRWQTGPLARRTFVPMDDLVPPEVLPCPACRHLTEAPMTDDHVEVVRCAGCGKVLRRRRRLSDVERAQALAWRWAAAQFARDPSIERLERRRKLRGDPDEGYAMAMRRAAETLLGWARTVHKRPAVREGGGTDGDRGAPC